MADFTLKYSGDKINELLGKADTALQEHQDISGKQDKLVSGENIKTFNGESILGKGNIEIKGGDTPDWNSPEGASGHIKNRTHYQTEARMERHANSIDYILPFAFSGAEESFTFTRGEFLKITFPQDAQSIDLQSIFYKSDDPIVEASYDGFECVTLVFPEEGGIDKFVQDVLPYFKVTANVVLDDKYIPKSVARVSEDGYLYSNGEKVDMRFTRSLLPVGASIPAKANLNTKQYLKIGKYYCSLNADAKTITNCPVNVAFSMEVFNPLGTNVDDEDTKDYTYRIRVLTQYDTGQQYMQFCKTSGTPGSWTYDSWYITTRAKFTLNSSKNDGSAAVGSATQGAYVDSTGTLTKMTYTLAKSVPSNAVFTDTKVTAAENHYTPKEDETAALSAPEGEVVTGIKRDNVGHVVGIVTSSQKSSVTPDWDASRTEDGYIKNRTHYHQYEGLLSEDDGIIYDGNVATLDFGDATFNVLSLVLDGYFDDTGKTVVVNNGMDEDFFYDASCTVNIKCANQALVISCDNSEYDMAMICSHIKVYGELKTLDEIYIPDTIARKSDIDNAIQSAITNVLNTPV